MLHPAFSRHWMCTMSPKEGITLGVAASLSQEQCLKKDTAVSHQQPKFQSSRRMTTVILKGDLGGTRQHQTPHS